MKPFQFLIFLSLISCSVEEKKANVSIVELFPNLTFEQAVDIQTPKDATNRLFVLSQPGIIYVFDNKPEVNVKQVFLDIRKKVLSGGEMGLLGLAFHHDYKRNGSFYVDYTTDNPRRTVISKFQVSKDNPSKADPKSEEILLEVNQPYENHNGGQITFGPDGYLYISLGNGGAAGDPLNSGQNLKTLLGSILRIDVNKKSTGKNYSIPNDNPFKNNNMNYREEIFAYGLRNVWRFSFDKNNTLWAGDVGQNAWEEIDIIQKGENYGWRIMEGLHCFNPNNNCDTTGLVLPIWEYGHDVSGGFSITGGFVYSGQLAPALKDKYIYADYVVGKIWVLEYKNGKVVNKILKDTDFAISTFGVDENKELYFADYRREGKLYKFVMS